MPEGDSIARLAARLRGEVVGETITLCRLNVPRFATVDLSGQTLDAVLPRGKHLLMRFSGGLTLHSHLRMSGRWAIGTTKAPPRGEPWHQVRVRLGLGDGRTLWGVRLPIVEVVRTADEPRVVGHLGPDLLDPMWDDASTATALARLTAAPSRPLVEALLDQRNVAGIGNLYAVEGCYLARRWPWTPVADVTELPALVETERALLARGVVGGVQTTTGSVRRGETHWVYGRYKRPCRRCSTPITFRKAAGTPWARETWWCPRCQPAPAPG